MKNKVLKTAILAASVTALMATSVFAMSQAGQKTINNIMEYFRSDKATVITSIEELGKHNNEIGKSVSKDGYTMTLDNVAADDNFIHVFYTVKSDGKPFYSGDEPSGALLGSDLYGKLWIECMIDGKHIGFGNHNGFDSYFVDPYSYKSVCKYNVATLDIPDEFTVELFGVKDDSDDPISIKLAKNCETLTEEEKNQVLYISTEVNKSDVKVESVTKALNLALPWSGATVEKAIFSPFGNQLVISMEAYPNSNDVIKLPDDFAIYDENGVCLDVLNTDLSMNGDGSSQNSFEFLKADKNTKQLRFVPQVLKKTGDSNVIKQKIGSYPLTYQLNDFGKVIVTDIRILDGEIDIDYYKDGFILYDPGFNLLNDAGDDVQPGGKLGCTLYTDVNYDNNSYTARYVYEKYDDDFNPIPMDDSVSAENLRKSFTTLGIYDQNYVALDFDRAVTVDLN